MTFLKVSCALVAIALQVHPAQGQVWWPEIRADCPLALHFPHGTADCIQQLITDEPFHLVVVSLAPQSGLGLGLGINHEFNAGRWNRVFKGDVVATLNGSYATDDTLFLEPRGSDWHPGERSSLQFYLQYRRLQQMDYYGLGPNTPNRPFTFGLTEQVAGAKYLWPVRSWVRVGSSLEYREPALAGGAGLGTVLQQFTPSTAPGQSTHPEYLALAEQIVLRHPSSPPFTRDVSVTWSAYNDLTGHAYSFWRLDALGSMTASLGDRNSDAGSMSLLARAVLSRPFGQSAIPFYYQPSLGGTDFQGFDTLRGFADLRFRGPDYVLGQIEYSHSVLTNFLHALAFYDGGSISLSASGLTQEGWKQDVGLGLEFYLKKVSRLRIWRAFGGEQHCVQVRLSQNW